MLDSRILYSYLPLHNNRFILLTMLEKKKQLPEHDNSDRPMTIEGQPKVGISDAATNNKLYCALLKEHDLESSSNSELKSAILQHLSENSEEDKCTISQHILKETLDVSQASNEAERKLIEEDVIALWRVHRYSVKSISAKMLLPKETVNRILSKYRSLLKKQCRINKKHRLGIGLKITLEHIEKMKEI